MAALFCLLLGGSVVADGWIQTPPEVSSSRSGRIEVELPEPSLPPSPPALPVPCDLPRRAERGGGPAISPEVDPSGWLGRRHLRSPA